MAFADFRPLAVEGLLFPVVLPQSSSRKLWHLLLPLKAQLLNRKLILRGRSLLQVPLPALPRHVATLRQMSICRFPRQGHPGHPDPLRIQREGGQALKIPLLHFNCDLRPNLPRWRQPQVRQPQRTSRQGLVF